MQMPPQGPATTPLGTGASASGPGPPARRSPRARTRGQRACSRKKSKKSTQTKNPKNQPKIHSTKNRPMLDHPSTKNPLRAGPRTPPRVRAHQFLAPGAAVATRRAPEGQKASNLDPRGSRFEPRRGAGRFSGWASGGCPGRFRHPWNAVFHPGLNFSPVARKRPPEAEIEGKAPKVERRGGEGG